MAAIRNALAFPFYLLALASHLLCALFTAVAQEIAGDQSDGKPTMKTIFALGLTIALATAIGATASGRRADQLRLIPQAPMDFRGAKAGFTPENIIWVRPMIETLACVVAERAVRHAEEPIPVSFPSCAGPGVHKRLDDNLIDVVISGVADVGATKQSFEVVLEHNPPSTDEDGFIVTGIRFASASAAITAEAAASR